MVSSSVLLRHKLRLHRGGILSKNYTAKLEYVWLSVRVKVSPKKSEVGSFLLLNLYLKIHFFYVASDTNRIRRKRIRTLKKSCCNFGPAWIISFKEIPSHYAAQSNTIRTSVVDLSILTTEKWGKHHTLAGGCSSEGTFRKYPIPT